MLLYYSNHIRDNIQNYLFIFVYYHDKISEFRYFYKSI